MHFGNLGTGMTLTTKFEDRPCILLKPMYYLDGFHCGKGEYFLENIIDLERLLLSIMIMGNNHIMDGCFYFCENFRISFF